MSNGCDVLLLCVLFTMMPRSCACVEGLVNSPSLEGVVEQLSKAYPDEPRSAVEQAVADAMESVAGTERIASHDQTCVRDYSVACPLGWADLGDGLTCSAPFNYRGTCPSNTVFGGLTPSDKSLLASKCSSVFPCVGAHSPDYDALCPDGWVEDAAHFCVAPVSYVGPCVARKRFSRMSSVEKTSWAVTCGISWPRRTVLPRDVEAFPSMARS
jgi:CPW-WPC domain-containing protein